MFFKLLMFAVVVAAGAYYYDLNTAEKKIVSAEYASKETEDRCRNMHESMCKYFMTVKVPREKLDFTFRIPNALFRMPVESLKARQYPVQLKMKKLFPMRVLGLAPKFEAELEPQIKTDG